MDPVRLTSPEVFEKVSLNVPPGAPGETPAGTTNPDKTAAVLYQIAILAAAALLICSAALL